MHNLDESNRFNLVLILNLIDYVIMFLAAIHLRPTIDRLQSLNYSSEPIYLSPGEEKIPFCLKLQRTSTLDKFVNIEDSIVIHTNLSFFHLPIYLYNAQLTFNLFDGGMASYGTILLNLNNILLSSIYVNTMKEVKIVVSNSNPIEISIEKIFSTYSPNSSIQLLYMKHLSSNKRVIFNKSYTNLDIAKLVIPAQHQAIFSIFINGTNIPKAYIESIKFETPYQ
ncbi:unnamed protein product, partial [Didymodactylos carnosus]